MKILDACCGSKCSGLIGNIKKRFIWITERKTQHYATVGKLIVKPDIVADFREMPFKDETFYLVVFDPPHLVSAGNTSFLKMKYGNIRAGMERGYKTRLCRMLAGTQAKWNVNF